VIYVMSEAAKLGYRQGHADWVNLGQGAPETGSIPGAPARISDIHLEDDDHEYARVDGTMALKEAVAKLYNERYRQGKKSLYGPENVAINPGGRTALTRLVSTLGHINVGHFLPDYTAYDELLGTFGTFSPIPILLNPDNGYAISVEELKDKILGLGLSALLLSNPCNPTGKLIQGDTLENWVNLHREVGCALIMDEFYSHYIFSGNATSVSAASYVEDVNEDAVMIIDGLTKNWRYPGWRVSWTLAPASVIEGVASAGSFMDGGCAHPMQKAALPLIEKDIADQEAKAIQKHFLEKRNYLTKGFEELGIRVPATPDATFYLWGDLSALPEHLNTGMKFFKACLQEGVITVPGSFFDINPGGRRPDRPSRFEQYSRFSFGPSMKDLTKGLKKLKKIISGQD
jgi:aspartate/methionine/tyrosine aminotransferase